MLIDLVPDFFEVLAAGDRVAAYQRYYSTHRRLLEPYWHNYVVDPDGPHFLDIVRSTVHADRSDLHRMLDGYWDDTCYFNCPSAYVPNYPPDQVDRARHMGFVVATGEQDHLVEQTRHFAGVLRGKGLNVHEEVWPGVFGHDWPFWAQHLPRFV